MTNANKLNLKGMVMTVQVVGQFKISVMFISFRRKCLDDSDF